jgi:hypothetical protein
MVALNTSVVDCQKPTGDIDFLYLTNIDGPSKPFAFDSTTQVTSGGRRSIFYNTTNGTFLLTATITNPASYTNNSFINVYRIDLLKQGITLDFIINPGQLNLTTLAITDIGSDVLGNIYISDFYQGIIRFQYDGIQTYNMAISSLPGSLQIYTIVTRDHRIMVYVAT